MSFDAETEGPPSAADVSRLLTMLWAMLKKAQCERVVYAKITRRDAVEWIEQHLDTASPDPEGATVYSVELVLKPVKGVKNDDAGRRKESDEFERTDPE